MTLLAIDPGTTHSAWIELDGDRLVAFAKEPNDAVLTRVQMSRADRMAIEIVEGYGMNVGNEVFTTCRWGGRFVQAWLDTVPMRAAPIEIGRKAVKLNLCGTARSNDAGVMHAIAERYGFQTPAEAKGKKREPGPLFGVAGDVWAALAVGLTVNDLHPPRLRRVPTRKATR